jgi:hypothetical protein
MGDYTDFVILSPPPKRERIAVVWPWNRMGLSEADGADRDAYMESAGGLARYFMVVSQDDAFLWRNDDRNHVWRIPMHGVIARFLPDLKPGERLYHFQLEMIVSAWLSQLTWGARGAADEPENQLVDSGFLDSVRNAQVLSQTTA